MAPRPLASMRIDRLTRDEVSDAAHILAIAYARYPLHTWAMSREPTLQESEAFFGFYLRRGLEKGYEIVASEDRSAVLVTYLVRDGRSPYATGTRQLPSFGSTPARADAYFAWIDAFRPRVDHWFPEMFATLPKAPLGTGYLLYQAVLREWDRQGVPSWSFTADPRNLPFFQRLGFEAGEEIRRDADTPPVTPVWRPVKPAVEQARAARR